MEYADMISRIVAAEHNARALVQQAKEKESHLQEDLDGDLARMRESYLERARHRLSLVEQEEQAAAAESIQRWDQKLEEALSAVESSYEKNKERWVDTLVSMIVGTEP